MTVDDDLEVTVKWPWPISRDYHEEAQRNTRKKSTLRILYNRQLLKDRGLVPVFRTLGVRETGFYGNNAVQITFKYTWMRQI